MLLTLPAQHHEDEASLFLPIGQPSQDFEHNQLNFDLELHKYY